jgi:cytochrome b561
VSAAIIIGLLTLGIYMTPFDEADFEFSSNLYFWHKSFGMLALLISLLRIYNRRKHTLPDLPKTMARYEQLAAKLTHKILYVLLVLIPVLGYIQSSAYEFSSGVNFFFFDLPEIIPKNKTVFDTANFLHKWLSYFFIAALSAHVLGAVKHRFFDKENDVLERML